MLNLVLAAKFSAAKLLNSGVVIYLSWSWSVLFFSISLIFVLYLVFLTKLLTLGILFSTAVRAVVVANLAMLGIFFLTSFDLALRAKVVAKLVILSISPLMSFILALKKVLAAKLVISVVADTVFKVV